MEKASTACNRLHRLTDALSAYLGLLFTNVALFLTIKPTSDYRQSWPTFGAWKDGRKPLVPIRSCVLEYLRRLITQPGSLAALQMAHHPRNFLFCWRRTINGWVRDSLCCCTSKLVWRRGRRAVQEVRIIFLPPAQLVTLLWNHAAIGMEDRTWNTGSSGTQ